MTGRPSSRPASPLAQAEVVFIHEGDGGKGEWLGQGARGASGEKQPSMDEVEHMLRLFYSAHAPDRINKVLALFSINGVLCFCVSLWGGRGGGMRVI